MVAQGGTLANIFRWREVSFGQKQMHTGMLRRDNVEDLAFKEQQQRLADLIKTQQVRLLKGDDGGLVAPQWGKDSKRRHSKVALIYDYSDSWTLEADPQRGFWKTNILKDFPFVFI